MMNGKQRFSSLKRPISRALLAGMAATAASVVPLATAESARAQTSPVSPTVINPTAPTVPPGAGGSPITGQPPVVQPPVVQPPVVQPPVVQPPVVQPPVVQPPVVQPPVVQPPVVQPPVVQPPVVQPPVVQPPVVQPPVVQPPVVQPPVVQPPVVQPPVVQPPVVQPPVVQPPVVQPPVVQPPPAPVPQFGVLDVTFVQTTATALGVDGQVLFQSALVQASIRSYGTGAQSFLQAAEARFRAAGIFNIDSYNNPGFVSIVDTSANLTDAIGAINGLSIGRLRVVSVTRTITLFRSTFSGARFSRIGFVNFLVYKSTTIRAITLPPVRTD